MTYRVTFSLKGRSATVEFNHGGYDAGKRFVPPSVLDIIAEAQQVLQDEHGWTAKDAEEASAQIIE